MRRVKFKKFIKAVIVDHICKKGTNCWEKDFTHKGKFHEWGEDYEEFESCAGNYSIALVELEDGTIEKVLPENVKFID